MKKGIRNILIVFVILIILVIVDTMQAKMFNRSPILRVRETTRDKDIYIDRGILVNYYHCYRETITTWKNAKYLCSQKEVQETEEVPILNTFYARIIDVNSAYIVVLPYNDMEERAISDKFEIHLSDFNASLYHVNTNVKITYDGKISEGELPQIEASKIEIKSADSFELIFTETGKGKKQIINKRTNKNYNYNVYVLSGEMEIIIDNNKYKLEDALKENKITIAEIIAQANEEKPDALIYKDGGSKEYHYPNYTIIKMHTTDGNRDVYFGSKDLTLNDIN